MATRKSTTARRNSAPPPPSSSPYLTPDEAAEILRVSRQTVYDLCRKGRLEYIRAGDVKLIRITRASLDALAG